jgi:hypothetical protein
MKAKQITQADLANVKFERQLFAQFGKGINQELVIIVSPTERPPEYEVRQNGKVIFSTEYFLNAVAKYNQI